MSRFNSDQNKVVLLHESGTYASTSGNGYWIGQVTENSIDDAENKIEERFLGTATRSYNAMDLGPRDVTGTLSYHPQDMRLVFWAIGSVNEAGTANHYVHYANQVGTGVWQNPFCSGTGQQNPPISFTIEDSQTAPGTGRNFIRTIVGCTPNTITLTASQGEKVTVECEYLGKSLTHTSGNSTNVTEITNPVYLWNHSTLTLAGSSISTAKELSLEINNNIEGQHYVNGSRDISFPKLGNKDYTLSVTADLDSDMADALYTGLYKSNGIFNAVWDMNADNSTGSAHVVLFMSGCRITTMEAPSTNEGTTELSMEIRPQSVIGSACDRVQYYNVW